MSTNNENQYHSLVNWGNGLSILFAAVGVLAVIIIVFQLLQKIPNKTKTENIFKIEYNLQIDSSKLKKLKNQEAIEYLKFVEQNNKKIAEDFTQQINDQYDRTQKLIELKEEQNLYNTYGAGIIAIILAIGSFFGFKSINQMHKDTIDIAKIEAEKTAAKEAKEFMSIKLEEIKKSIQSQVLAELREEIKSVKIDYTDLNKRVFRLERNQENKEKENTEVVTDQYSHDHASGGLYTDEDL